MNRIGLSISCQEHFSNGSDKLESIECQFRAPWMRVVRRVFLSFRLGLMLTNLKGLLAKGKPESGSDGPHRLSTYGRAGFFFVVARDDDVYRLKPWGRNRPYLMSNLQS